MASPTFGGLTALTLDFDIEARPLSWYGGDLTSREVTAIAWKWTDLDDYTPSCMTLNANEDSAWEMLVAFAEAYSYADIVTGHYIRGYDLPTLNGAMIEHDLPPLEPKWSVDTKLDLIKRQGWSGSQESIAAMLGIEYPKIQMTQQDWREANRLTPEGIEKTKQRVIGDVNQHVEMLVALRERGLVGPGKLWSPKGGNVSKYTP